MTRHSRPADGEPICYLLHGPWLASEKCNDVAAIGIAERIQWISLFGARRHLVYGNGNVT